MQVHLKTTNTGWTAAGGYASPTFDSGAVVAEGSKATLDLNATAYGGLSAGLHDLLDDAGSGLRRHLVGVLIPTSFARTAKGTLTITSPSSGTPVVNDYTPPVVTTFSGATAEKHRLFVTRLDTLAEVFDSGDVKGTGLQETIQNAKGRGVLTTGVSYRATWRTWDTVDRAVTLGDPDYVEATRDFTLTAGATAAATAPVLTPVTIPPGVTLTVTSTTAPDEFTWLLDGKEVATGIPTDYAVGGTSYAYTFTGFRPGVAHTFAVARVIGGVAGPLASASTTVRVPGLWLVDPADRANTYLFVADTGGSAFTLREEGETMFALGAQEGVRITEALGGYGGTVTGRLVAQYGKTLQQWVDLALRVRSRPGRPYVLQVGSEMFEVVVWNVNVRPTGDSTPTTRTVSFEFAQTSEQRIATYV